MQVKWYRNGQELSDGQDKCEIQQVDNSTHRLILNDVYLVHAATYKIEASNDYGKRSSECDLTVSGIENI